MAASHRYFVYMLTNHRHTVLYTGVTGDLHARIIQHREKQRPGFTTRYNVDRLIYFEEHKHIYDAIEREKQIKAGSRQKKLDLVSSFNPDWKDLSEDLWQLL